MDGEDDEGGEESRYLLDREESEDGSAHDDPLPGPSSHKVLHLASSRIKVIVQVPHFCKRKRRPSSSSSADEFARGRGRSCVRSPLDPSPSSGIYVDSDPIFFCRDGSH